MYPGWYKKKQMGNIALKPINVKRIYYKNLKPLMKNKAWPNVFLQCYCANEVNV